MATTTLLHDGWELIDVDPNSMQRAHLPERGWLPANVPGGVHPVLIKHGRLEDPYYDENETKARWIEEREWWYRTTVHVEPARSGERLRLVFQGVDTLATIYFGDIEMGSVNNMFREWTFDVTELVRRPGAFEICVRFLSPVHELAHAKRLSLPFLAVSGKDVINNLMRKAQCAYGWDWGPRLPNVGLWRPVELRREKQASIDDVLLRTVNLAKDHSTATVLVGMAVDAFADTKKLEAKLVIRDPAAKKMVHEETLPASKTMRMEVAIKRPKLWWTHDLGEPFLYDVEVTLLADGKQVDARQQKLGVRELVLDQSEDPVEGGQFFRFLLNGAPMFARGGDWIPLDCFPGDVPDERYRQRFTDARAGNMNMLRIWGGGIYEHDIFYELADELGLLVWQDFMFANVPYPEDEAFAANVEAEVRYQVRRLRSHACLAAWCGNNETYLMVWGLKKALPWYRLKGRNYYEDLIPRVVSELDPGRWYQPSSPFGGKNPNSDKQGDIHDWHTWHGFGGIGDIVKMFTKGPTAAAISYEHYAKNTGRFMTEFGIHGQPDIETWKRSIAPEHLQPHSIALDLHNKDFAKQKMDLMMDLVTGWPKDPEDLRTYVDYSQITQGEGLKFGLEHFRRRFPHTAGTLVWQYNDCYPVQSWSVTDYYGFLKGSYYYVARSFAPVIASFRKLENGDIALWLTNNSQQAVTESVRVLHQRLAGDTLFERKLALDVPAHTSKVVVTFAADELTATPDALLWIESGKATFPPARYFFAPVHELPLLSEPKVTMHQIDLHTIELQATSEQFVYALRVHHASEYTRYSDNFVDIRPGGTVALRVHNPRQRLTPASLEVSWNL